MRGRLVAQRYRLESLLGRGGGGVVWRAVHVDLNTPAAVKLLNPSSSGSSDSLGRFKREAKAAASLQCSNVVQIFDFGVDDDTPYIAMELLEGESLAQRLAQRGRLTPPETATILTQVARALDLAHERGIVHRDLKPDNVFLARDAGDEIVKVLDFGIAKLQAEGPARYVVKDSVQTQTGTVLGTPHYMSLEQVVGEKTVDHRTDVWAMAVIACECLTGRRPFVANTFGALALLLSSSAQPRPSEMASVPVGFDEWFARCTARHVKQRYSSIRAAAKDFELLVATGKHTPEPSREVPERSSVGPSDTTVTIGPQPTKTPANESPGPTAPPILKSRAPQRDSSLSLLALVGATGGLLLLLGALAWLPRIGHSPRAASASNTPELRTLPSTTPVVVGSAESGHVPNAEEAERAPSAAALVEEAHGSPGASASTRSAAGLLPGGMAVPAPMVASATSPSAVPSPSAANSATSREDARRRVGF